MASNRHGIQHKELRVIVDIAIAQGWAFEHRRNNHLVLISPTGEKVFTSSTPSDWRALMKIKAQLRRMGVNIPR